VDVLVGDRLRPGLGVTAGSQPAVAVMLVQGRSDVARAATARLVREVSQPPGVVRGRTCSRCCVRAARWCRCETGLAGLVLPTLAELEPSIPMLRGGQLRLDRDEARRPALRGGRARACR
jgi:hypothetical protein